MSPNCTLVFGNFIYKTQLLGIILSHASNEVGTKSLVPFKGNALQAFLADSHADKFIVDRCVVYWDEAIGLEHAKEFVEKIVGILSDKLQEIMDVGLMKSSIMARAYDGSFGYISCLLPNFQDSVEGTSRKSTAEKDVVKWDELAHE